MRAGEAGSAYQHCFVFGCGRTGSTPLVRLLGAHEQMAIGMDRYKFVLRQVRQHRDPDLFTPALFDPGRFMDFRPSDTNLVPPRFEEHYARIAARLAAGAITQLGDKLVPTDLFTIRNVADRFPRARFVFVFRDLVRVANSFEVRARDPHDPDWPPENGYPQGLRQWTEALDLADVLVSQIGPDRVFPVHTNVLFGSDTRLRDALFSFLGLDVTEAVRQTFDRLTDTWQERQAVPVILEPSVQRALVDRLDQRQLDRYRRRVQAAVGAVGGDDRARRRLALDSEAFRAEAAQRAAEVVERAAQTLRRTRALASARESLLVEDIRGHAARMIPA